MTPERQRHFTLWNVGSQQLQLAFDGGCLVSDAGPLAVRALEKPLRILADLAQRLPDPRAGQSIEHSAEAILTQTVYQILAGYPDCNDAQQLRDDPLFQILADVSPDADNPLASPSTLARFQYAFTRRQAERPAEERPVLLEVRAAQTGRIKCLNDYLVDLFIRTRRAAPAQIILDVDASDDPVHGHQTLSGYHGSYRQHQYLPLFVYDGATGFPLAAWLRPGTVHASLGAADILDTIVTRLRAAWPGVAIQVRSDNGLAVPGLYDYSEAQGLPYAFGYATNPVLQRATDQALADLELYHHSYRHREPVVQRFESLSNYQADSWPHPRRIIAKIEVTPQGSPRRFVVTDRTEPAAEVYRDFYVQRGKVPEQPIGEMKNGLQACQCLPFVDAYAGLRHCGAIPRSRGDGAGGGRGDGEYVTAAAVEDRRAGGDESASHLVAPVANVAVSRIVGPGAGGGATLREAGIHGVAEGSGTQPRAKVR